MSRVIVHPYGGAEGIALLCSIKCALTCIGLLEAGDIESVTLQRFAAYFVGVDRRRFKIDRLGSTHVVTEAMASNRAHRRPPSPSHQLPSELNGSRNREYHRDEGAPAPCDAHPTQAMRCQRCGQPSTGAK